MNQAQQIVWPFNPDFPKAFCFPAFGTAAWLAFAWWDACKGDAAKIPDADKIRTGAKLDWQCVWGNIAKDYISPPSGMPNTTDFSMKHPEGWVQPLLDADRFWSVEINFWALQMVVEEYRETNPDVMPVLNCANFSDWPDGAKLCEHFCHRFYAYQQARYRWHEHLLEKHCPCCFGQARAYPLHHQYQANACLLGWLSKQRGYAKHPLVRQFCWANRNKNTLQWRAFDNERKHPSKRPWRADPDEMGWLILTWPIWNSHGWRWTDIAEAVIKKFRFVDAKGKPLDFLKASRKRLQKTLRENSDASGSKPAENALALIYEYLSNPTPKEKEMHEDWERTVRSRRMDKAFEKLCCLAIGSELEKKILRRPIGRGTDKKPPLWDFAQQISA